MSLSALLTCLILLPALLLPTGCASLEPNHVTVLYGHDEAETASERRTRTGTNRGSISMTYDLPR